jgi:hypothetical protein
MLNENDDYFMATLILSMFAVILTYRIDRRTF